MTKKTSKSKRRPVQKAIPPENPEEDANFRFNDKFKMQYPSKEYYVFPTVKNKFDFPWQHPDYKPRCEIPQKKKTIDDD